MSDVMVKYHHQPPSFMPIINKKARMASLVELSEASVAVHTPVPELLACIENLPSFIRHRLFQRLSNFRLREMEVAWEAGAKFEVQKPRDGFDPMEGDRFLFDCETQCEWEARLGEQFHYNWRFFSDSWDMEGRTRNFRHVFWEKEFLRMLRRRTQQHIGHVDELMENQRLFVEVVRVLKLSGEDICKDNAEILLALRYLRRLEVHFYYPCWETMRRLVKELPHLTELKFNSGRLSDSGFANLYVILVNPSSAVENRLDACRITVLEFISIELPPEGYRRLVALVGAMPQLLHLKVDDCIQIFDTKLLVNAALCLPALERLFLRTDWIEGDAFDGLEERRKPLALRHLHLYNNNVSLKIVEAICRASMEGVLNLERLELSENQEIRDSEIHALTAMLASPVVGSASVLTHLDLDYCGFGIEGVTSLLLALGHHNTLTLLNVGHNDFDVGFGDVLADFLLTNSSITHLKADHVYLKQAGVSARLLTALESNRNLTLLSLRGNMLCSGGASAILGALVKRAQVKPFAFVDLGLNYIDLEGLKTIADIVEGFINVTGMTQAESIRSTDSENGQDVEDVASRKRQRDDSSDTNQRFSFSEPDNIVPIEELRLLDNVYDKLEREYTTLTKSIQRRVGRLQI